AVLHPIARRDLITPVYKKIEALFDRAAIYLSNFFKLYCSCTLSFFGNIRDATTLRTRMVIMMMSEWLVLKPHSANQLWSNILAPINTNNKERPTFR